MRNGRRLHGRQGILAAAFLSMLSACAHAPAPPTPVTASFGDFTPPAGYARYLACPQDY